jgi:hypothetical protein
LLKGHALGGSDYLNAIWVKFFHSMTFGNC